MMTYDEAVDSEVSQAVAKKEVEAHGLLFDDFTNECGVAATYKGHVVLEWLGY